MSFALPPIVPPAPAPVAGAVMPAGAADGFDGLMASLFGGTGEPPPQVQPHGQALNGGKLLAQPSPAEGEALLEPQIEGLGEGLPSLESQLAAASLLVAPTLQTADLTVSAAAPPTETVAAQAMLAGGPFADVMTNIAEPDGAPGNLAAQAASPEPMDQPRSADPPLGAPAKSAEPLTTAAGAAAPGAKVTVEAPVQTDSPSPGVQAQAAAQAGQSAAHPLMTSALAAGVTGLRATQSVTPTATTSPADPASDPDADAAEPAAAAKAAAKPVFGGPPPTPIALTGAPGAPITAKAEPAFTVAAQGAGSEVIPVSAEATPAGELDAPDLPGTGQIATSLSTSDFRDPSRVAATPATVADLAAQVSRKLEGRNTHFDIQLTPEGLGKVDVRVDIDAQGRLTAAMAFDTPQAASEMRGRSGELMRALEQAGFDLSGGLSFSSPQDQGGGGRFADQAPDREAWQDRAFQTAMAVADEADAAVTTARAYQPRLTATGVDVRI